MTKKYTTIIRSYSSLTDTNAELVAAKASGTRNNQKRKPTVVKMPWDDKDEDDKDNNDVE